MKSGDCVLNLYLVHLVKIGVEVWLVRRSDDDKHTRAGLLGERRTDVADHPQVSHLPPADILPPPIAGGSVS